MANPTQVTETQYGFAEQLAPFANNLLEDTSKLTDIGQNPYMQYQGDRQAQFTPLQQQAFNSAALQAPAYQTEAATGLAGLAANKALGAGYTPSNFAPGDFTSAGTAQQFMNPYQQNVRIFKSVKPCGKLILQVQNAVRALQERVRLAGHAKPLRMQKPTVILAPN